MSTSPIIVWIRRDLRLFDNPALFHAAKTGRPVIPLFIWAPSEKSRWKMGEAQQWWLHHSLTTFSSSLQEKGQKLILQRGPSEQILYSLAKETGAQSVYWNSVYEPTESERDERVSAYLQENGIETIQWNSQLLHEPTEILTGKGTPYKVFTPFWRTIQRMLIVPFPLGVPEFSPKTKQINNLYSLPIGELSLLPKINWAAEFHGAWKPGEESARQSLLSFLDKAILNYNEDRDFPYKAGTSKLSAHLHFGEISPTTVWHEITKSHPISTLDEKKTPFLRQLIWREFAYHLIHHFPHTSDQNLRSTFDKFPWSSDKTTLVRWQKGETGYPIVDAGMRQLWRTGWMHNRVRMIVASFLTKHLLTHWLEGAQWFWDTLVDANLPNNTMGWQWAAGSGTDAQPFFRIFNPINQGKKFDVNGDYVRRWVPELEQVPNTFIHEPWLMTPLEQQMSQAIIGRHYPAPVVDHKEARARALDAYKTISK